MDYNIFSDNEKFKKIADYIGDDGEGGQIFVETNFEEMSLEELKDYRSKLEEVLENFNNAEPDEDTEPEKHEQWEDMLLDVEELLDEIDSYIENLEEE